MTRRNYKPQPGSIAARVVELLRFLPRGTSLRTGQLCKRLGLTGSSGLTMQLMPAVRHGLLRAEASDGHGRHPIALHWSLGRGVELPAVKPQPIQHRAPVRSVFDLAA